MISVYKKKIKACATCRYLQVLDKGCEFENILDSEYMVFHCTIRDWTVREDYLMKPQEETDLSASSSATCPFWEEWVEEDA